MKQCLVLFLLSLALIVPALGNEGDLTMQRAIIAFRDGDFLEAALLARRAGTAEGYAYAARAGLVYADFLSPPGERLSTVLRAEEDARLAIAMAPDFAEGRLQLAIALGFRGRLEGHMTAHFEGLADEARTHLDRVIEREPDNPWAHALLGGWHLEIAEAGGLLGRTIYGATVETGIAEYERALALKPGDVVVTAQCALQLAALGDADDRQRARALIDEIQMPDVPDALHLYTLRRLRDLETALVSEDDEEIMRVVQAQKGFFATTATGAPPTAPRPRHQVRPTVGLTR